MTVTRRRIGTLFLAIATCAMSACSSDGSTATTVEVAGLRFVTQPAAAKAGVPFTVAVELVSVTGARVTTATNTVTLSVSNGAAIAGQTTAVANAGLATFPDISINTVGQSFELTAHSGNLSLESNSFSVTAGPASTTASTYSANPTAAVANANSSLSFTFRDAFNHPIIGASVSFSSNTSGTTFTPPTTTTDGSGGATTVFRSQNAGTISISANIAGTNITFPAPIVVGAGAAGLRFVTQPTTLTPGAPFTASVEILDQAGQRLTTAASAVTLTLSPGALQGTTTANAVDGLATFNNLSIATTGAGFVLTATSGALSTQSAPFNVSPNVCVPGDLTLGTPVNAAVAQSSGCQLNSHPAASFRFFVPQGNAIVVSMGATSVGGLTPELAMTPDPPAADAFVFVPSAQTPVREWLLAPGLHLATVSATNGAAGNFTITTTNTGAGAPGCIVRILANTSAIYTGQALANTSPSECFDPEGSYFEDRFLIYDSRPCTIRMSSDAFDPFMSLRDLSLTTVIDDDDSGGNLEALISVNPCRNGPNPFIIGASSFEENSIGAYTLTVTFGAAPSGQGAETVRVTSGSSALKVTTMRQVLGRRAKR